MTDTKVLSAGERLTIRMVANKLKQVYGEGFLLENELINGCYQLLASHAELAERLKAMTESKVRCWNDWTLAQQNVDELEERLKACEAERDALAEAFGVGGERESLSQLIAERDTLKAENARLQKALSRWLGKCWKE